MADDDSQFTQESDRDAHQGVLFGQDIQGLPADVGYRGAIAQTAAGITYRQLDYWARTQLVVPTVKPAAGSGSHRLYSFRDILVLRVVKKLLDSGVSLQNIRVAVDEIRERGIQDLANVTLMSDGASVYMCTSSDEIIDLLAGGQGVFAITLDAVWKQVEGTLSVLPVERTNGDGVQMPVGDELAERRARKQA